MAAVLGMCLILPGAMIKLKERICTCSPAIAAQVVYARDVEMAQNVEDVMERRLGIVVFRLSH